MPGEQVRTPQSRIALHLISPGRFIVREFDFSEEQIEQQKEQLVAADTTEKELWVCHQMYLLLLALFH